MKDNEIKSGKLENIRSRVFPNLGVEPSITCTRFSERSGSQKIVEEDEEACNVDQLTSVMLKSPSKIRCEGLSNYDKELAIST